ncbi:MAG: collagen-like protein [Flavobacteriaceae bacterium]|nr:collagen-like protein [Flavobacteriaceae bacterium]
MKYVFLFTAALWLVVDTLQAQIKIGDNIESISPYALLELESGEKGLLIPRLSTQQRNTFFGDDVPAGMIIFNSDTQKIQYVRSQLSSTTKKIEMLWENISNERILSQSSGGTSTLENPTNGMVYYQEEENDLYIYNAVLQRWILIAGTNYFFERSPVFNQHIRYVRSNGTEETLDLSSLSTSDSQTLTVSETMIGITNGNQVDVQPILTLALAQLGVNTSTLVGPKGDRGDRGIPGIEGPSGVQGIQGPIREQGIPGIQGPPGVLAISSNTDSQTLTVSSLNGSKTLTIAISNGNTETLDLSSLSSTSTNTDSQTIQVSSLNASNTLTLAISNGNTQTLDLSALAVVNLFEVDGNVVRSSVGTSSHDFVFGSDTLDNQTGALDDARFFFDKSKAAFRAGYASGNSWNEINIGERSFGMGYRTQALAIEVLPWGMLPKRKVMLQRLLEVITPLFLL